MARVYDSLARFYDDPARRPSPERDVGLCRRAADGRCGRPGSYEWLRETAAARARRPAPPQIATVPGHPGRVPAFN